MDHQSLLQTIAEVGATFAGLAAVIAAIRGEKLDESSVFAVRDVIEASIIVTMSALIPFLFFGFELSELDAWKGSLLVTYSLAGIGLFASLRRARKMWLENIWLLIFAIASWLPMTCWVAAALLDYYSKPDMVLIVLLIGLQGFAALMFLQTLLPRRGT